VCPGGPGDGGPELFEKDKQVVDHMWLDRGGDNVKVPLLTSVMVGPKVKMPNPYV